MNINTRLNTAISVGLVLVTLVLSAVYYVSRSQPPTLDDKIGQMLLFGFLGSKPQGKWARRVAEQIAVGEIGGVVFLGHNFKTRQGVKGLTKLFGDANASQPAFIALDMEGGFVQRLGAKLNYEKIPPAQIIAQTLELDAARKLFDKLALMTASAGFNVNLGPVVDLLISPENPVVGKWQRSYGADPDKVIAYAHQFIAAHRQKNILTVLKHFPGHGSSLSDSHDGFVDISKSWHKKELIPFKQLIKNGDATAIMPGHVILHTDTSKPVSLSKGDINGLLRTELKFNGLVISDDLQMSAIGKNFSYEQALILAINAGVDVLMISNTVKPDLDLPVKTIKIIKRAIKDNRVAKSRVDSAYNRILSAKKKMRR